MHRNTHRFRRFNASLTMMIIYLASGLISSTTRLHEEIIFGFLNFIDLVPARMRSWILTPHRSARSREAQKMNRARKEC